MSLLHRRIWRVTAGRQHRGDLHRHRCLNYRWPTNGSLYRWEFECDGEKQEIAVEGPVIVDEPEVLVRLRWMGLALPTCLSNRLPPVWPMAGCCRCSMLDAAVPRFLSVLSGKPPNAAPAACFYRLRPSTGRAGRITRFLNNTVSFIRYSAAARLIRLNARGRRRRLCAMSGEFLWRRQ